MDQTNVNMAPLPLRVITLLGLIGGFFSLLASLGALALFGSGMNLLSALALLTLVKSVLIIISLFGLRKMKKWAYYVFVVNSLLIIGLLTVSYTPSEIFEAVVAIAFLAYLYSLKNRFV